jgi:hypothetical protein
LLRTFVVRKPNIGLNPLAAHPQNTYNQFRDFNRSGESSRSSRHCKEFVLLTEQEVSRSWSQMFKGANYEAATFDRAEQLLDELRSESPLRHRLTLELEELRNMHTAKQRVGA